MTIANPLRVAARREVRRPVLEKCAHLGSRVAGKIRRESLQNGDDRHRSVDREALREKDVTELTALPCVLKLRPLGIISTIENS